MITKQEELFLWVWSRRRQIGQLRFALIGFAIGGLGGFLFTILMFGFGGDMNINYDEVPPALMWATRFGPVAFMLLLAVPAFGGIGAFISNRIYAAQEYQYQTILERGGVPPSEKPQLTLSQRGPMLAVIAAFVLIALFILFVALAV